MHGLTQCEARHDQGNDLSHDYQMQHPPQKVMNGSGDGDVIEDGWMQCIDHDEVVVA